MVCEGGESAAPAVLVRNRQLSSRPLDSDSKWSAGYFYDNFERSQLVRLRTADVERAAQWRHVRSWVHGLTVDSQYDSDAPDAVEDDYA